MLNYFIQTHINGEGINLTSNLEITKEFDCFINPEIKVLRIYYTNDKGTKYATTTYGSWEDIKVIEDV